MLAERDGYDFIRCWLAERCGMNYPEKKRDLLTHRLNRVLARFSLTGLDALAQHLTNDEAVELQLAVIHAASTNHTFFFREPSALDVFRKQILPAMPAEGLRVWSAAASSGDEAYTLAIIASEALGPLTASRVVILGTDISPPAIAQAEAGVYGPSHLEQVPLEILQRYFTPAGIGQYQVIPEIKRLCLFRRLNLKAAPYPFRKGFHAVFCRNVLYYFERAHQFQILEQLYDATEPGGWLLTSVTEVVRDLRTRWQPVASGVYRRPQS
jgi:chemotaxis protein methyltransferase CheR